MFTARQLEGVPIRTYGKLRRGDGQSLVFHYRPWLFLPARTLVLPKDRYAVGRGLSYPEVMRLNGDGGKVESMFVLPPRYRTHEEEVARAYALGPVVDVGILRGLKAIWGWVKSLFGFAPELSRAAAAT
jgi:hypothetical protein